MYTVSVDEKKDYLRWFLNKHQLKRRESVWILNYILGKPEMLDKVHFVENAQHCPLGVKMATHSVDDEPFRLFFDERTTTDAEKAFHHIRLNTDKYIYIELLYKGRGSDPNWYGVAEENSFDHRSRVSRAEASFDHSRVANNLLHNMEYYKLLDDINKLIDECLEVGDKESFMDLANQRNILLKAKPNTLFETIKGFRG